LSIAIDQLYRHILSDETAEYVNERGEQRFDRCGNGIDPMRLYTRSHAIKVKAALAQRLNGPERRMVRFRAPDRSHEQRVEPILTHGMAQILGNAQAGPLQHANHLGFTVS